MKRSWLALLAMGTGLSLAVPALLGGRASFSALIHLRWWEAALPGAMVLAGWACNAVRLQTLAGALGVRLDYRRALPAVIAIEFAGAATPAGAGGPTTLMLLLARSGLPAARGAAVTAIDHLTDAVFFLTAVPAAVLLLVLHDGISHPARLATLVLSLLGAGIAVLMLLLRHHRPLALRFGRLAGRIPRLRRRRYALARMLVQFRQSIKTMLAMGWRKWAVVYLCCLGHWLLRYSVLPVVVWFMGRSVPWGYLFVIQGILLAAAQWIAVPGGGGGVELGFSVLVHPYLDPVSATGILVIWRFFTFYLYLLAGVPFFLAVTRYSAERSLPLRDPMT
jgi:uncharacterized protein (TIRG00374 family)